MSSRACIHAPITPFLKKKILALLPKVLRVNIWLFGTQLGSCLHLHDKSGASSNQSGKQCIDSDEGVFKKCERAALKGRRISEFNRLEEM